MTRRVFIVTGMALVGILRIIGAALYRPDDEERISIWSIRKQDARIFYLLLSGLWLVAATALAYAQYAPAPPRVLEWATPSPHIGDGSAYAVAQRFGALVIPLMVAALVFTPVIIGTGRFLMALAQFINEKILDPIIEAKAVAPRLAARENELRAEVTAVVTAEVTAAVDERWAGWLARRDAALAEGRDFDEPRPDAGNRDEHRTIH